MKKINSPRLLFIRNLLSASGLVPCSIVVLCLSIGACQKQTEYSGTGNPSGSGSGLGGGQTALRAMYNDFAPKAANIGDTISIFGTNMMRTDTAAAIVQFDSIKANVIYKDNSLIRVVVPPGFDSAHIRLTISQDVFSFSEKFYVGGGRWNSFPYNNNVPNKAFAKTFTIGQKIYILGGYTDEPYQVIGMLTFDLTTGQWDKRSTPFPDRQGGIAFSIGNKGYFGLGSSYITSTADTPAIFKDLWEYDPVSDEWTRKNDFPGWSRANAIGFAIGGTGYAGLGSDNFYTVNRDFWSYNPGTDAWTRLADFPGEATYLASATASEDKGYVLFGVNLAKGANKYVYANQCWEFDPANQSWKSFEPFPNYERQEATAFVMNNKLYAGLGFNPNHIAEDFWEYDISQHHWARKADFPESSTGTQIRRGAIGASVNGNAYIGFGAGPYYDPINDWWQFKP
jgi:N-acetylneuraminic acid mutarotase